MQTSLAGGRQKFIISRQQVALGRELIKRLRARSGGRTRTRTKLATTLSSPNDICPIPVGAFSSARPPGAPWRARGPLPGEPRGHGSHGSYRSHFDDKQLVRPRGSAAGSGRLSRPARATVTNQRPDRAQPAAQTSSWAPSSHLSRSPGCPFGDHNSWPASRRALASLNISLRPADSLGRKWLFAAALLGPIRGRGRGRRRRRGH